MNDGDDSYVVYFTGLMMWHNRSYYGAALDLSFGMEADRILESMHLNSDVENRICLKGICLSDLCLFACIIFVCNTFAYYIHLYQSCL